MLSVFLLELCPPLPSTIVMENDAIKVATWEFVGQNFISHKHISHNTKGYVHHTDFGSKAAGAPNGMIELKRYGDADLKQADEI